jgi:bacterioferritin
MANRVAFEVGGTVQEMLIADLDLEIGVAKHLNEVMARCEAAGDNGTRSLLEELLNDTEHDHIRWFEAQLKQISDVGIQNYLQAQL